MIKKIITICLWFKIQNVQKCRMKKNLFFSSILQPFRSPPPSESPSTSFLCMFYTFAHRQIGKPLSLSLSLTFSFSCPTPTSLHKNVSIVNSQLCTLCFSLDNIFQWSFQTLNYAFINSGGSISTKIVQRSLHFQPKQLLANV